MQGERPHGGLRRFPLLAWRLVIAVGPEGMPDRCGGPLHARWSQALGTLETPGHPGFLPAAFRPWRAAGLLLPCSGGRRPCALLPAGAPEAGRQDGSRAGQGLQQGASGMTLGALGHGLLAVAPILIYDREAAIRGDMLLEAALPRPSGGIWVRVLGHNLRHGVHHLLHGRFMDREALLVRQPAVPPGHFGQHQAQGVLPRGGSPQSRASAALRLLWPTSTRPASARRASADAPNS